MTAPSFTFIIGHTQPRPEEPRADLHNAWFAKLSEPKNKILRALIAAYPHALTKEQCAELAGASATSSAYQNNLGNLRSLGLIDYRPQGHVVATKLLFPEGLR